MENNQIIYTLNSSGDRQTMLKNAVSDLTTKLNDQFGNSYSITAGEVASPDKDWTHEIKVRKGDKIGAELTLKWEEARPAIISIEVDESSKMGSLITYGVLLPFVIIGAYMAYNDIEPLAFLPGYKIAAGLGGVIAVIPGSIVVYLLKSIFLKKEKEENKQLVTSVINTCKNEEVF